jgi:hypothetical protein
VKRGIGVGAVNLLSSIHTVLRRMAEAGEVERVEDAKFRLPGVRDCYVPRLSSWQNTAEGGCDTRVFPNTQVRYAVRREMPEFKKLIRRSGCTSPVTPKSCWCAVVVGTDFGAGNRFASGSAYRGSKPWWAAK